MSFIPAKIQILQFILVESGTYDTQYRRAYTTDENESTAVDELRDRLAGRRVMGPGSLAGFADQIVKMSPKHSGELNIDQYGWGNRRFLFMLSLDIYAQGSTLPNRQIITGFSETNERSLQGTVDPDMRFTINTMVNLRSVVTMDRGRRVTSMVPMDVSHVLANQSFNGLQRDSEVRIDPYDVMGLMMVGKGLFTEEDDAPLYNYTGLNNRTPTKVQRKFAQPANYLAGILKGFGDAATEHRSLETGMLADIDHATLCGAAQQHVSGSSAASDAFLLAIRSVSPEGYPTNFFTLRDLSILHPGHPSDLFLQGQTRPENAHGGRNRYSESVLGEDSHESGRSESWGGVNIETQFAAIVSQGVPGLMMELFFTEVHFRARNETSDGSILVEMLVTPKTLEKFDCRAYIERFEDRLATEILQGACMNGAITFDFECRCDIVTETWIDISVGGGEGKIFNTPTFCDALMTPMLSDADNANGLANDMNTIVSDLVLGDNACNKAHLGEVHGYEASDNYGYAQNRGSNTAPRIIL